MGDATIKDSWSAESEAAYQKSLRDRGIEQKTYDPTIFKGKIGIVVNVVFETDRGFTLDRVISIPGKYFGQLSAIPTNNDWYNHGDFSQVEIGNPKQYYVDTYSNNQVKIIDDPVIRKAMLDYVLEEIFENHPTEHKTRFMGSLEKSAYYTYGTLKEYADFYIYPNSPVDKWIEGNSKRPYDHTAPTEFGVSFTIVRRDSGLIQGGDPDVYLEGIRLARDDSVIPYVDVVYKAPVIKFGGRLLTSDFGIMDYPMMGTAPLGVPRAAGNRVVPLYFYKGNRRGEFERYIVESAQADLDSSDATDDLLVDLAGSDAEPYVIPGSPMEAWIKDGNNSIPAPNFRLQFKMEVIEDPQPEDGLDESEVKGDGTTTPPKPQADYLNEEDGYEGEGSAPEQQGDSDYLNHLNEIIDQLGSQYADDLDKQQPVYEVIDKDGDGDYKEADDLFGTKQGESKPMTHQTSLDFQESAPTDYFRPFDEYDNEYQDIEKDIAESKVVSKRELQEFEEYCEEAYMSKREFDLIDQKIPQYYDGRKDSYLVEVGNAEARIYEYYDSAYNEQRLVIAFRGTTPPSMKRPFSDTIEFARDVMTDLSTKVQNLEYIGIKTKDVNAKGIVHQGFADYVNLLYEQLLAIIKFQQPNTKLYICGHSLGAAASIIFSYMIFMREGIVPTRIYQFGAPMGIWTFGDNLNKNLPIINVLHTHDIITPVSALFKHHGTKLVFDLDGNLTPYAVNMEVPMYHRQKYERERLLFALRKNGAYRENSTIAEQVRNLKGSKEPSPLLDNEYDSVINSYTFTNFLDNIGAIYENYKQPAQQEALAQIQTMLYEAGFTFYHTRYKQTIDEWKNNQVKIDEFRYFSKLFQHDPNPRAYHHKPEDKKYHSSIGDSHFYTDSGGNFYYGSNSVVDLNYHPIGNTEPLGIMFYDKNMNIQDKAIVFYS